MRTVFLILSILVWLIPLYQRGMISEGHTMIAVFVLIAAIAISRLLKGHLVRRTLGWGTPLASLATFVAINSQNRYEMVTEIASLGVLVLALYGLVLIVSAPFRSINKRNK